MRLSTKTVDAGGGWWWARGGRSQVGREGEVMRVGVLNDSYKLLPEPLPLYSTPAVWGTVASVGVKEFLSVLESSKLSIGPESSLGEDVANTWPTRSFYFFPRQRGTIPPPARWDLTKENSSPSDLLLHFYAPTLFSIAAGLSCCCSLPPRPCIV